MDWYLKVLNDYAVFEGRASRSEYWYFTLFNIIIIILLSVVENSLGLIVFASDGGLGVLSMLYALAVLVPSLAVGVRRLHDTDRSGWWMLLAIIPIVSLVLIVFFIFKGSEGDNQYGASPL
jgi:uncharacterized membrane protein YhaH (DUF805 family)